MNLLLTSSNFHFVTHLCHHAHGAAPGQAKIAHCVTLDMVQHSHLVALVTDEARVPARATQVQEAPQAAIVAK